jgi:hypothetical protein
MNAQTPATSLVIEHQAEAREVTPLTLLDRALSKGADMATLEKFMDLQERHERNQARKAFDAAISAAKAEIPVITKNRVVDFTSTKGRTHYAHEDLAGIARVVDPILSRHGLSYRFRTSSEINQPVSVTCIVSHRDGHSEENTLCAGRDGSGNKNDIQQIGSTITYLQRYTLKAALGLAAAADDDGQAAGGREPEALTDDQIAALRSKIMEANADLPKFLDKFQIEIIDDLPPGQFKRAMALLDAKIAKGAAA